MNFKKTHTKQQKSFKEMIVNFKLMFLLLLQTDQAVSCTIRM